MTVRSPYYVKLPPAYRFVTDQVPANPNLFPPPPPPPPPPRGTSGNSVFLYCISNIPRYVTAAVDNILISFPNPPIVNLLGNSTVRVRMLGLDIPNPVRLF